jgi:hypothetical protein
MVKPDFRRRDTVVAGALGLVLTFSLSVWYNLVAKSGAIDSYLWLASLQEPGTRAGEWTLRALYHALGYPWNVRCAVACAYVVLAVMWTLVAMAGIAVGRIAASLLRLLGVRRPVK